MASLHSSFLIQSLAGDFEVVLPRTGGGLDHYYRDQNSDGLPWRGPVILFGSHDDVTGATLVESGIGGSTNLHTVYREGSRLAHDWGLRIQAPLWPLWHGPTYLPGTLTVTGTPAFVAGPGSNVHVVAPVSSGGLAYWSGLGRSTIDRTDPARPPLIIDWSNPVQFGQGNVGAVALLYGVFENVEAVVRVGDQLFHYWQDHATGQWNGPFLFAAGAAGQHCWLESNDQDFQLVSPMLDGGLAHWRRDNHTAGLPWSGPARFGTGNPSTVGFIQAAWGNFELVAAEGGKLSHYWRAPDSAEWNGPFSIPTPEPPDPAVGGQTALPYRSGCVAIHAGLLRTGNVLVFGYADESMEESESRVLNPVTGALTEPGHTPHSFCSGHTFLSDGRLLIVGGHFHDLKSLSTFDPGTSEWTHIGTMEESRWYPTCCPLSGGRVLTVAGTGGVGGTEAPVNNTIQIYDPASGIGARKPIPTPFSSHFSSDAPLIDTYPLTIFLPSGKVLVHSRIATRFFDPATEEWDTTDLRAQFTFGRTYPGQGNGILLPLVPESEYRARVLVVGGCGDLYNRIWHGIPATNTVEILDLGDTSPAWRFTTPMSFGRVMCDSVLLPDGTVLVLGGSSGGAAVIAATPVLPVELFDPASETWLVLASLQVPRLYHSTAILLPDARVLVAGKDGPLNPFPYHYPEHRVEIFSPPYLFRGPRPAIESAPGEISYDQEFAVGVSSARAISSAVLLRPETTTHSVHMDQRMIGLRIAQRANGQLRLVAPPNSNIAPEGYYMLFLLNHQGVPSVARFVRLE
jgi:hypothetical protein